MSDMNINQVLGQMRAMAAAAASNTAGVDGIAQSGGVAETGKLDFGTMIRDTMNEVSETQMQAKELATAFESGDRSVELPEVMVALQKANISFQAVTEVRNKLLNAYQEVMNMQV